MGQPRPGVEVGVTALPRNPNLRASFFRDMRPHFLRLTSIAVTLALALPAGAEEQVIHEADKTVVRKRTVIDFSDVAVEGELIKPEGSYSVAKRKTTFKTLIRVRDNFTPELRKSVENL